MKLGILGAGFIAHVMADTVQRMQAAGHGEVELYAVAAREEDRARDFARQYGMPCAFGSYEAMLQDPAVDFVYIATPHSHHYRHTKLCVDHGKHILSGKNMVNDLFLTQAEGIIAKIGFQCLFFHLSLQICHK